ncbi:MAG: apolipoprotein N-acyltransferase [Pseudomonadota bacterium]
MKKTHQILLAVLSGILVCISFPTLIAGVHLPEMGWVAWIALVPLIIALRRASPRRAFSLAFLSAIIWYGGSLFWVYRAMHTFGHLPAFTSLLVLLLLVLVVAAYTALAPMLARFIESRFRGELIVWLPAAWTAVEILRNYGPCNGFPWSNLAMSQWRLLPLIQIADLVGIYGIIFLIVWFNVMVAEIILKIRGEEVRFFIPKIAMTALLTVSVLCYGLIRLHTLPRSIASFPSLSVGIVQGNIAQEEKWDKEKASANLAILRAGSKRLADSGVEMIVWPESSFPWPVETNNTQIDPIALGLVSGLGNTPYTLFGAISETPDGNYYNSALLFDGEGAVIGRYHKAHLVPFGEYVPYGKLLFFAKKLTQPVGNFIEGETSEPLVAGFNKAGILICYEDIFPEIARNETLSGAGFFANLTNDAWYGVSSAPYQHLALSVFRAVENRRFLIRATNSGVSAVVMPTGQTTVESGIFERALIVSPIAAIDTLSPYTLYGDWFAWACVAYTIFGAMMAFVVKLKKRY